MTPADAGLVARVAALDLSAVQRRFEAGLDPSAGYHVREATSLEYRRLLLLARLHPDLPVRATGHVGEYHRLHVALPGYTEAMVGLAAGPRTRSRRVHADEDVRDLYDRHFPCGDTDLWGWAPRVTDRRHSAPGLESVCRAVPGLVDHGLRRALHAEALALRPRAVEGHAASFGLERGAVSGGSGAFSSSPPGPVLWREHWSGRAAYAVSRAVGQWVVPTGVFSNFHPSGASSPLHTDPYAAELALLTHLAGPVEPLYCHTGLVETPLRELLALAESTAGQPGGGTPHDIGPAPFLFAGQSLPHHRVAARRTDDVVVAAQYFGVLLPRRPVGDTIQRSL